MLTDPGRFVVQTPPLELEPCICDINDDIALFLVAGRYVDMQMWD